MLCIVEAKETMSTQKTVEIEDDTGSVKVELPDGSNVFVNIGVSDGIVNVDWQSAIGENYDHKTLTSPMYVA